MVGGLAGWLRGGGGFGGVGGWRLGLEFGALPFLNMIANFELTWMQSKWQTTKP